MALIDSIVRFLLPIRIVQAVFAVIVLGLTAYVASWWSGEYRYFTPSEISFLLFTSVWTLLVLIYLILTTSRFERFSHKYATVGIEAVTMIFWFAGFIATAVFFSDRVCWGSVCSAGKAATAFGAFTWVLFVITSVIAFAHVFSNRHAGTTSSAPVMTSSHHGV